MEKLTGTRLQFDIYEATKTLSADAAVKELIVCKYEHGVFRRKLETANQDIFGLRKTNATLEEDMSDMEAILKVFFACQIDIMTLLDK